MRGPLIGRVVLTADAVVVLVGSFLPWLRSGSRRRNSYDIFSLVERIGYSPNGPVGWAVRMWPALPLLLIVAVTLLWSGRELAGAVAGIVASVYAGAVSIAVRASSPTLAAAQFGSWVTLVGAAALMAGAAITLATSRGVRAPREAPWDGRS